MRTTRGSAHYAGLLPVELSDGSPPIRPTTFENDALANRHPPGRKRASRVLSRFLIAFSIGVAATSAWQSYGDEARQMIANSYEQLGWLAPRRALLVHEAPDAIAAPAVSYPDQLDVILRDLHAMRQSLDGIVAGQELITRSIDGIATSVAARQAPTTRSTDQTAATVTTGQGQVTRNIDQTTASVDQAPSAKASSIKVESRDNAVSLQPTVSLNIKPREAKPPQTSSERGKQLPAAIGHDASCFPSASAVLQNHPGGLPSWTLRAPGHEGTLCWHAAARPKGSEHQSEVMPSEEIRSEEIRSEEMIGTTENRVSAPPAPNMRPAE